MNEKATSRVPVSPDVLDALNTLKEHPRETHNDVLKRLIKGHEERKRELAEATAG